ncbi:hypothetical protein [Aeromicrobium wangtongii]|uniref:hypothetical protein n=1 Tax=Aeromicrobium wangtongii TaxID=2969247 RepID=UPI002017CAA9|nr:hypothetical protein [Aeromicrobium wangtongii]MCL3818074.1 hypothetical protein [Aeromicrobium wangtongii]
MLTQLLTNDHGYDGPGPWWPLLPLMWFAFFILAALIFMRAGRARRSGHGRCAGEARLAERFATGEIDESEYRQRLAVLREKDR